MGNLAFGSLSVEAFHIPGLAGGKARLHVDLREIVADDTARQIAMDAARGDERAEDDHSVLGEDLGEFRGATDVLQTVVIAEAEVRVQPGPQIVAVQTDGKTAL